MGSRTMKINSTYKVFITGKDVESDSKVVVILGSQSKPYHTRNFAEEISFNVSKVRNFKN